MSDEEKKMTAAELALVKLKHESEFQEARRVFEVAQMEWNKAKAMNLATKKAFAGDRGGVLKVVQNSNRRLAGKIVQQSHSRLQQTYDALFQTSQSQLALLHAMILRHGKQQFDMEEFLKVAKPDGAMAYIDGNRLVVELKGNLTVVEDAEVDGGEVDELDLEANAPGTDTVN